jgi:nucleoredoxin
MKLGILVSLVLLCVVGCAPVQESDPRTDMEPSSGNPIEDLFGTSLLNAKGEEVSTAELAGKKIGVYFSAAWCPPCRGFTPKLVNAYNGMKAAGKPFELVFVSSDRDAGAAMAYMNDYDMPWLATPFAGPVGERLKRRFGVRGIPMLVVVDADGNTLSTRARNDVDAHGANAFDRW